MNDPRRLATTSTRSASAHTLICCGAFLGAFAYGADAFAAVDITYNTIGYPERAALDAALDAAVLGDDEVQEIAIAPDGEWLVITDADVQYSSNFHLSARIVAGARWGTYGESIDAVAVGPNGSYVVIANGARYSSLVGAQNEVLFELLVDGFLAAYGSIDEIVFDEDGEGWAITAGDAYYSYEMPQDFYDVLVDADASNRAVRAMSMNADGGWSIQAANWFASGGTRGAFRRSLAEQNRAQLAIDHIHENGQGGYIIASNADYVYGAGILDQVEANTKAGTDAAVTPLWENLIDDHIVGASMAYYVDGELVERRGYGLKEDGLTRFETERWVGVNTRFEFASISKTVAAATTLAVISDPNEAIALDSAVDSVGGTNTALQRWITRGNALYLVNFPSAMTIAQLLSHTSGLEGNGSTTAGKSWGGVSYIRWDDAEPTLFQLLIGTDDNDCTRAACSAPANNGGDVNDILWAGSDSSWFTIPGEGFYYSGGGYTVLEAVLAAQTGNLFPTVAEYRIFQSLGMTRTTYLSPADEWGAGDTMMQHKLVTTLPGPVMPSVTGPVTLDRPGVMRHHAAASLVGTPADVGKVGVMIAAGGLPDSSASEAERIIDEDLITEMTTSATLNNGQQTNYGLGLNMKTADACVNADGSSKIVWHTGDNGNARATLAINRDTKEVIVISFAAADNDTASDFHADINTATLNALGWNSACY